VRAIAAARLERVRIGMVEREKARLLNRCLGEYWCQRHRRKKRCRVLNGGAPTPEAALASAPREASEAYATTKAATPLLSAPSVIAATIPSPAPSLAMTVAGIDAGADRTIATAAS